MWVIYRSHRANAYVALNLGSMFQLQSVQVIPAFYLCILLLLTLFHTKHSLLLFLTPPPPNILVAYLLLAISSVQVQDTINRKRLFSTRRREMFLENSVC